MYENYPQAVEKSTSGMLGHMTRQTLRERLVEQRTVLAAQLKNLDEAIGFLDKNPSFENFHNVIGKAGF